MGYASYLGGGPGPRWNTEQDFCVDCAAQVLGDVMANIQNEEGEEDDFGGVFHMDPFVSSCE